MSLDDCTVYVFVRQDIPLAQQLVQSCHAIYMLNQPKPAPPMASGFCQQAPVVFTYSLDYGTPNMIVVGVPDTKALERVRTKLERLKIEHCAWSEPDFDIGFTAIATAPLTEAEKLPLANYRLWRYSPQPLTAIVSDGAASPLGGEPGRLSSEKEHSVSNGEVTGSIPVVGSKNSQSIGGILD